MTSVSSMPIALPLKKRTYEEYTSSNDSSPSLSPPPYKKRRKQMRVFYSLESLAVLEAAFEKDKYPSKYRRYELAAELGVNEKNILIWFTNRRCRNGHMSIDRVISTPVVKSPAAPYSSYQQQPTHVNGLNNNVYKFQGTSSSSILPSPPSCVSSIPPRVISPDITQDTPLDLSMPKNTYISPISSQYGYITTPPCSRSPSPLSNIPLNLSSSTPPVPVASPYAKTQPMPVVPPVFWSYSPLYHNSALPYSWHSPVSNDNISIKVEYSPPQQSSSSPDIPAPVVPNYINNITPQRKARFKYDKEALDMLNAMFNEDHYPNRTKREELAKHLGISQKRVYIWFQNKRRLNALFEADQK